jgi:uncharacterized protein with NRDE domain
MCLIVFANGAHPDYPLIVAANRDEAYARPAAPAAFWTDHPDLCAGRDLEQGGTWLGLTTAGRFAAVTNYRQAPRPQVAPRSRGELTREFLTSNGAPAPYLQHVQQHAREYRGFSLIVGVRGALYFYSNFGSAVAPIAPGVHGLSNHLLDEPWPKVRRGIAVLSSLCTAAAETLASKLFEMLADRSVAPDYLLPPTGIAFERERDLSPAFIAGETYGTRASTVILVGRDGEITYIERRFGSRGAALGCTEQRFHLTQPLTQPAQFRA